MRAIANTILSNVSPVVRIEHLNQVLNFSISFFGRVSFQKEGYDVFSEINAYWDDLPEERQQAIFDIYKDIHAAYSDVLIKVELTEYVAEKVKELLAHHQLDDICHWISFKSDITIPESFNKEYKHSFDSNTTREKTYTRSDYFKLIGLSLCLRCMVPVWGEHVSNTRQEKGTYFKEFYAFQLLNRSDVLKSEPMEKLKTYIDFQIGQDKYKPDYTLRCISSEDFIYWLLSLICVRKLCISDIRGIDSHTNVITFLYKYIIQKIDNSDSNFENRYKEKLNDQNTNPEHKLSTLERYKIKTNISPGEIVELEFSLRDIRKAANELSSRINPVRLERSLETCQLLKSKRILDPQMTLLSWVFKPVISPRGLMYLTKDRIINALGGLEAVLWARDHQYLAILSTAYSVASETEMLVSPVDSKIGVPRELSEELEHYYPFTRPAVHKKGALSKRINLVEETIDNLVDSLTMFSWRSTASDDMLLEVFNSTSKRLPILPNSKILLTKLVIELGKRSWL